MSLSPAGKMGFRSLRALCSSARTYTTGSSTTPYTLATKTPLIRPLAGSSTDHSHEAIQRDFMFWPNFYTAEESEEILKMALWKLDRADSTRRRRRKSQTDQMQQDSGQDSGLQKLFHGEYGFEEGHYDSVIHDYRETLLSSLPPSPSTSLTSLLSRLYSLLPGLKVDPDTLPPPSTSTHLLHLSPKGAILPHVDNLEASGFVILGLSLGAERTMRLKKKDSDQGWELRLPSGSVYLQRDSTRYQYEHSILPYEDEGSVWDAQRLEAGHRVSVMVRDAPPRPAKL